VAVAGRYLLFILIITHDQPLSGTIKAPSNNLDIITLIKVRVIQ